VLEEQLFTALEVTLVSKEKDQVIYVPAVKDAASLGKSTIQGGEIESAKKPGEATANGDAGRRSADGGIAFVRDGNDLL